MSMVCKTGTPASRVRHPTAPELSRVYIDLLQLLSSQCRLSSLNLHRSDCRFGDPARRHIVAYSADPAVIKAADIELLAVCERDNFCRLINTAMPIISATP